MARQQHYREMAEARAPGLPAMARPAAAQTGDSRLLAALQGFGEQLLGLAARDHARFETGRVDDAVLHVNRQFEEWKAEYRRTRQGRLAAEAQADFTRKYDELAREAMKEFNGAGNEIFGGLLERRLQDSGLRAVRDGAMWQSAQMEAWLESQTKALEADLLDFAAKNPEDDDGIASRRASFMASLQARQPGLDYGAVEYDIGRKLERQRLGSLLASGNEAGLARGLALLSRQDARRPSPASLSARNLSVWNYGNVKNIDGKFNAFAGKIDGLMAVGERMLSYNARRGAKSVQDVINIYAPARDGNKPKKYAQWLAARMGVGREEELDFSSPDAVAAFIRNVPIMEHGHGVSISPEDAREAARRLLDGQRPRVVGRAPDAGAGGALDEMGSSLAPAERAQWRARFEAARKRLASEAEVARENDLMRQLDENVAGVMDLPPERRADAVFSHADQMAGGDVAAREKWRERGLRLLKSAETREAASVMAGASALLQKCRGASVLDAEIAINSADAPREVKDQALAMLRGPAAQVDTRNEQALYEGLAAIDAGGLRSREERLEYARERLLHMSQIHKLLDYQGNVAGVTASQVLAEVKRLSRGEAELPPGFLDAVLDDLRSSRPGEKVTALDLRKAVARQWLSDGTGWFGGTRYFEASRDGTAEDWLPEVEDHERLRYDEALARHGYARNARNRAILKKREIYGHASQKLSVR